MKYRSFVMWVLLFICSKSLNGQRLEASDSLRPAISLKDAADRADRFHFSVLAGQAHLKGEKALIRTRTDLPKSFFSGTVGHVNINNDEDYVLTFNQNFSLPLVYKSAGKYYRSRTELAERQLILTRYDLQREVKKAYYEIIYLNALRKNLLFQDSLYRRYYIEVLNREKDPFTLERINADARLRTIEIDLLHLEADYDIAHYRLNYLINSETEYTVSPAEKLILPYNPLKDTAFSSDHPFINPYRADVSAAENFFKWEKNKMLPDLSLGYLQQSYGSYSNPGHMIQLGIGLPLWSRPFKARINYAEAALSETKNRFRDKELEARMYFNIARENVLQHYRVITFYDSIALARSDLLLKTAELKYNSRQISYTEYLITQGEALNILRTYLDTIRQFNTAAIEWQYWTGREE